MDTLLILLSLGLGYHILCLSIATKWKYFVLSSPSRRCLTLALWKRRTSSSLKILASLSLAKALEFNLLGYKQVNFAFLSSSSINSKSFCFSFFINPVEFFAHPLKYCRRDLILFCHICMAVSLLSCCQIEETKSKNPSLINHPNSNLNSEKFPKLVANKYAMSEEVLQNMSRIFYNLVNFSKKSRLDLRTTCSAPCSRRRGNTARRRRLWRRGNWCAASFCYAGAYVAELGAMNHGAELEMHICVHGLGPQARGHVLLPHDKSANRCPDKKKLQSC
jgi:hypothetical protein